MSFQVKHSGSSLLTYLKVHNSTEELQTITDVMIKIFKDFQKVDRLVEEIKKEKDFSALLILCVWVISVTLDSMNT